MTNSKKYNLEAVRKQVLHQEPQPSKVFYLQVSPVERIASNRLTVCFYRVRANEKPFCNDDAFAVFSCRFGANGEYSTAKEVIIIWGNSYLTIRFIDIEANEACKQIAVNRAA